MAYSEITPKWWTTMTKIGSILVQSNELNSNLTIQRVNNSKSGRNSYLRLWCCCAVVQEACQTDVRWWLHEGVETRWGQKEWRSHRLRLKPWRRCEDEREADGAIGRSRRQQRGLRLKWIGKIERGKQGSCLYTESCLFFETDYTIESKVDHVNPPYTCFSKVK